MTSADAIARRERAMRERRVGFRLSVAMALERGRENCWCERERERRRLCYYIGKDPFLREDFFNSASIMLRIYESENNTCI